MSIDRVESLTITSVIVILLLGVMAMKIFKLTDAYSTTDSQFLCKREGLSSSFVLELKIQLSKKNILGPVFHNVTQEYKNDDFLTSSYEPVGNEANVNSYWWKQKGRKTYTKQPQKLLHFSKDNLSLEAFKSREYFNAGRPTHLFSCTELARENFYR